MADHIDLTKDSDDEGQNTFESDAALARRLSAELNGEAPKNNKRTIDLTADSQEEPPPRPAQRARTSQEYSTSSAAPQQRLSIPTMKAAITQAGLATADLLERPDYESRYEQALDRLAERARLDAEREARDRARGVTVAAPTAPDGSRLLFFVVEKTGDRLAAHWNDGGERPPRAGLTRHWQGLRDVKMRTHPEAPATKARVLLAYDSDARRGEAWRRPKMAYRSSGSRYANGATALKSLMQKAARQQKDDISMRAAHELLALPKTGDLFHVLRRLLVISVEDSAPLDGINSVLVWLFAAACGPDWNMNYTPTEDDVAFILGAVGAVARCKGLSNGMKGQPTKLALRKEGFLAEIPLADVAPASQKALDFLFAFAVSGFAPDNGDAIMLLQAASLFSARDLVVPTRFVPTPMASIRRLKPEDWLLDFLCTHVSASGGFAKTMKRALIWDLMYEIDPDLEDEYDLSALEDFVRNKRAMVNTRYDYGDPRRPNQNFPEWSHWHAVADEAARRVVAAAVVSKPPW